MIYLTTAGTHSLTIGGTSASTAVTGSIIDTSATTLITNSGTQAKVVTEKSISPKLYFSFVKSKLKKSEAEDVRRRLKYLNLLVEGASSCGQSGLSEDMEKQMYVLIKDQEAAACGFGRFVLKADIDKFRYDVKDRTVSFVNIKNYPRAIPARIRGIIKDVKAKDIFDEMWVLYNDPKKTPIAKTTSEKIKEKDPILFGRFRYDEDRFFYITDWIDEHCDLTLEKFVGELKKSKTSEEYLVGEIKEPSPDDIIEIKNKVLERAKALENTNRDNYKQMEALQKKIEELESNRSNLREVVRELKSKSKRKWWQFWRKG